MYSPKITEDLIPLLYRKSKREHIPMTRLVNNILREHLEAEETPEKIAVVSESPVFKQESFINQSKKAV